MTRPRLATHMLVAVLRRRIANAGGFFTVVAKGDADAGAILLIAHHNRRNSVLLERRYAGDKGYVLAQVGPQDVGTLEQCEQYAVTRRASDPDLWVIEADIANAERFAAETIADG